jgi:hypothetical protein
MDINKFLDIEKKYKLNNLSIEGVNYWNYIRFELFYSDLCEDTISIKNNYKRSINRLRELFYIFNRGKIRKNADVLFFNHERRVKQGKYYNCVYTEELNKYYPNSVTFEIPYMEKHLRPVNTHDLVYLDTYNTCANIAYRFYNGIFKRRINQIKEVAKNQIGYAFKDIDYTYNCSIDTEKYYNRIAFVVIKHKILYRSYYRLIKKISPKVIVEVVGHTFERMVLNEIASKMGITTIELQHGVIDKNHIGYIYPKGVSIPQFPNRILLFSDYWKGHMQCPIPNDALIATGYPFFERRVEELDKRTSQDNSRKKNTIMFISQPTLGQELANLAIELKNRLEKDYKVIYKLHPSEYLYWKETYPNLTNSEVEVIDNDKDYDLYELFALSGVQIGIYSTAIYEGLGFGLKTFIYKRGYYEAVEDLIRMGYACYVESADDVIDKLDIISSERSIVRDELWKTDSLHNILKEINLFVSR